MRFGRQIVTHLVNLALDLRERGVGVEIQLEVNGDCAQSLRAGRLDIVDAVSAGNNPFERRSNETANEVCISPDVGRRDGDDGAIAPRILPNVEQFDRLKTGEQNNQVQHNGDDRTFDKKIGEFHIRVSFFDPS